MRFLAVTRILGLFIMGFGITMVPPILVSLWYSDGQTIHFLETLAVTVTTGSIIWAVSRKGTKVLRPRDGFLLVTLFWFALGFLSALPFHFSPHLELTDAVFEAVSGFTTTGATVIVGLDQLPKSILYYRQQLQWLGGMGIVVLAVAVLPMLGIGGMQLYRAEVPGSRLLEKTIAPQIANTARRLWFIYIGLTIACTISFVLAGMDLFDAIGHSFSTVSTGGFSTHDANLGYFKGIPVEAVAIPFMMLSGINFSVHFLAWNERDLRSYLNDEEVRYFLAVTMVLVALVSITLAVARQYPGQMDAVMSATFHVVSVITTTGYTTTDFSAWPSFLPMVLIFISFLGGCAGSTAGGIKIMRVLLLAKQGMRELLHLIHPRAIIPVRFGGHVVNEEVNSAVWGFFAVYIVAFVLILTILVATGLDQVTAFSAVAACMNNLGPALGKVSAHYGDISNTAKWVLSLAMILGRLEIFTLLVLLVPAFWRR